MHAIQNAMEVLRQKQYHVVGIYEGYEEKLKSCFAFESADFSRHSVFIGRQKLL